MNGLISLISLSALLLAVSGQFPTLSPDYSLQGTISIVDGNEVSSGPYSVSVDIVRSMRLVVETLTVTGGGPVSNNIRLYSDDDGAAYISVNNLCTQYSLDEDAIFPIDTNVWNLYAAGTELSPGTYSFTQDDIIHTVTIINGVPGVFTFTTGNTVTTITVTNFDDAIPDFSTFSLPSQCSQFTCNACYQPLPFPTLSPDYSLQGTISIVDGNEVSTGPYSVSVDIVRSMRLVVETLTVTGGGPVLNNIRLYSDDDGAAYISVNNLCTQHSLDEDAIFPIDTNVWNLYAAGTESPNGTYTFIQDSITHTVMIINGVPGVFTFTTGNTVTTITVTNFDDAIPDFSTFCLPSQCSGFTCNFCYSSAVSVSISIMLLLTTLLIYLFTTL